MEQTMDALLGSEQGQQRRKRQRRRTPLTGRHDHTPSSYRRSARNRQRQRQLAEERAAVRALPDMEDMEVVERPRAIEELDALRERVADDVARGDEVCAPLRPQCFPAFGPKCVQLDCIRAASQSGNRVACQPYTPVGCNA